jgi:hypothetical protein
MIEALDQSQAVSITVAPPPAVTIHGCPVKNLNVD